jgi:hypothetical protein
MTKIGEAFESWIKEREVWKTDALTEEVVYTYIPANADRKPNDPIEVAIQAFNGDRYSVVVNRGEAVLRVRDNSSET